MDVRVEVDAVSRDEPTAEHIVRVTSIDITQNGDLVLFKGADPIPSVGYTSGAWIKFEVIKED